MSSQLAPTGKCTIIIPSLGTVEGYRYTNDICQFCGVPYATLAKRWTRSQLCTRFPGGHHDGTQLGPRMPHPEVEGDDIDVLTPVPPLPHLPYPEVDEKNGLNMNIVLPPASLPGPHPIFVYVHGGSLLYGGAFLAIFDAVKLVSQSVEEGMPIVAISFNYRVGLGGFLAGRAIAAELSRDGHEGSGNFGLTDQQVALEWVQKYGSALGGDVGNVTLVGESAGGISISNQLLAAKPAIFHRAVCMSGLASSIPAWTMEEHQKLFDATCRWFDIDPEQDDVLDEVRKIPEQELANACPDIFGVGSGTGNPCLDGYFHQKDPREIHEAPQWLTSFMVGDVYHEGVIFHLNIMNDSFELWRKAFLQHIGDEALVDQIFKLYGIEQALPREDLLVKFEHMAGDAVFKIPNYLTVARNSRLSSNNFLYSYHFDQRSRIENILEGTAYHAYELLYLFRNRESEMNEKERRLARHLASAWIKFAHGIVPWEFTGAIGGNKGYRYWKIWGPEGKQEVVSEPEDEEVRGYTRMKKMLEIDQSGVIWRRWFAAIDAVVNKRWQLGIKKPDTCISSGAGSPRR